MASDTLQITQWPLSGNTIHFPGIWSGVTMYMHAMSGSSSWYVSNGGSRIMPDTIYPSRYITMPYRDNDLISVSGATVFSETTQYQPEPIIQREVVYMKWDIWNVLIVALICSIMVKVVLPRLTVRNTVRAVVKLIAWPFAKLLRKGTRVAKEAWKEEEEA